MVSSLAIVMLCLLGLMRDDNPHHPLEPRQRGIFVLVKLDCEDAV